MMARNVQARPEGFTIERHAFAKVNLDLRITGTREDGYHELSTVFQTISLHDVIRLESQPPDRPMRLTCDDPGVPTDSNNLVWRAAQRVWQAAGGEGVPLGLSIALGKRIPAGGGLGGGSANAAVALVALLEWWRVWIPPSRLGSLAAGLGADVPFFLLGGTARGMDRGDVLEPWSGTPSYEFVLVQPGFAVSTAEAYRWYDAEGVAPSPPGLAPPAESDWSGWLRSCRNDLEAPVSARHPELRSIGSRLRSAGALLAMLSGSGSTMFGVFDGAGPADTAAGALAAEGFAVSRARTLSRVDYQARALGAQGPVAGLPPASAIV